MEEEANTTQRRKQLTKTQQNVAILAQVGFCVSPLSPVCVSPLSPVCVLAMGAKKLLKLTVNHAVTSSADGVVHAAPLHRQGTWQAKVFSTSADGVKTLVRQTKNLGPCFNKTWYLDPWEDSNAVTVELQSIGLMGDARIIQQAHWNNTKKQKHKTYNNKQLTPQP